MGGAIIKGLLLKKIIAPGNIFVSDCMKQKARTLAGKYNVRYKTANIETALKSDVLILAVKPQDSAAMLEEISEDVKKGTLIISIMAGVRMEKIAGYLRKGSCIVRIMPNMAAFVGEAVSGISYNRYVRPGHKHIVRTLFKAIGEVYELPERMQDALTALTGSGPAYFFYFIESFINAAREHGFSTKDALMLATQTMKGSAIVLRDLKASPEELRKKVASKGGTTEAALKVFDKRNLKKIINDAVNAAVQRSKQLSR